VKGRGSEISPEKKLAGQSKSKGERENFTKKRGILAKKPFFGGTRRGKGKKK